MRATGLNECHWTCASCINNGKMVPFPPLPRGCPSARLPRLPHIMGVTVWKGGEGRKEGRKKGLAQGQAEPGLQNHRLPPFPPIYLPVPTPPLPPQSQVPCGSSRSCSTRPMPRNAAMKTDRVPTVDARHSVSKTSKLTDGRARLAICRPGKHESLQSLTPRVPQHVFGTLRTTR